MDDLKSLHLVQDSKLGGLRNLTSGLACIDASAAIRNRRKYGYKTPEEEYVQMEEDPDLMAIARKWGIAPSRIEEVCSRQNWKGSRQKYRQEIKQMMDRILKSDVADIKAKAISDGIKTWLAIQDATMAAAEKGYSNEVSPTGEQWQRDFGPKDYLDVAKTMNLVTANVNKYIQTIEGEDEEEADSVVPLRVTEIIYATTADPKALPEAPLEGEIVE